MFKFIEKLLGFGSNNEIARLIQNGAVIIDVRSPMEYNKQHLKESINIPLDDIEKQVRKIRAAHSPVITCCRSGYRSSIAAAKLSERGIEAYNGGSWTNVQKIVRRNSVR